VKRDLRHSKRVLAMLPLNVISSFQIVSKTRISTCRGSWNLKHRCLSRSLGSSWFKSKLQAYLKIFHSTPEVLRNRRAMISYQLLRYLRLYVCFIRDGYFDLEFIFRLDSWRRCFLLGKERICTNSILKSASDVVVYFDIPKFMMKG